MLSFQLMLGTASPWLGQSLFVFDFVFLVVGLPSIVSPRFGFQDLVFGVLTSMLSFIARGRLHGFLISLRLPFPLYSCISLELSSHLWWPSLSSCLPLEIWIMFSFLYAMWAWKVIFGLKCAELVSWSFGPFYPELCGFSVACRLLLVVIPRSISIQLMLGTASPWLGQSLFVFDFVFLVVGLPSIVFARFGFQDLVFGVLTSMLSFIARGRLHGFLISLCLPFPLYSCISLELSSHLWWPSLSSCLPLEIWI
ncbi:hypothetical protein HID58_086133, partial [Brassica napus]